MLFFVFHHLLGKGFCDPLLLLTFPSCPFKRAHVAKGPANNSNAQHIPAKSCVKINFLPHCNFRGGPYIYWRIGAYLTRCFLKKHPVAENTPELQKIVFQLQRLVNRAANMMRTNLHKRQKNTNLAKHLFLIIVSCSCKCWALPPAFCQQSVSIRQYFRKGKGAVFQV